MKTGLSSSKTSIALVLCLLLVLAHSLFRLAITPPWGFSDEEGHFEVVEYLVRYWRWPTLATPDLALRQEISDSSLGWHCDLDEPWSSTCIGVNQYDELPLFYVLQAFVQTVLPLPTVIARLYLARCVSLGLSLLTAWFAFQVALEVWNRNWKPAVLVLLVMGTNFSYVGTMLAVNNDTLAVCAVTFLIWAMVRLLRRGGSPRNMVVWVVALVVCWLAKSTTLFAPLLSIALIGIYWSLRWIRLRYISLILAGLGLGACIILINWDGQPGWNVSAAYESSSPAGSRVLSLSSQAGLFQGLPPQAVDALRGQEVTLRAYVYATDESPVRLSIITYPMFRAAQEALIEPGHWTSVELKTRIPEATQYLEVVMSSLRKNVTLWDGIALIDSATSRQWLFNGNGEFLAPIFRPNIGAIFIAGRNLNDRLVFIYDLPRSLYYYPLEVRYLFSTFWGGWGWNHVSLSQSVLAIYSLVTGLSGLGLLIWWLGLYRQRTSTARLQLVLTFGLALFVGTVMVQSILRVDYPQATYPVAIFASARYAFPIVVPFSILMVGGLMQWAVLIRRLRWGYRAVAVAGAAAFLIGVHATLFIHIPSFRESARIMDEALFTLLNH